MRKLALPIALCLATFACAASEESEPAGGDNNNGAGALNTSGSPGSSGQLNGSSGNAPGSSGTPGGGGSPSGTAGSQGSAGTTTAMAGTTGTGGSPPAGGSCVMTAVATTGMPLMIDDFEDGNADVMMNEGRVGGWYLATDMTGTTTPKDGPTMPEAGGNPGKAVHVSGSGLTGWGASLAASITPPMGCYDASKFSGITVMVKGTGSIWVSVLTAAVRAAPDGMRNHFKKQVTLSADWQPVTINFSELTQPGGWGVIVPFDPTKIYGIDFGPATAPPTPTDFDFWVDNLSFK